MAARQITQKNLWDAQTPTATVRLRSLLRARLAEPSDTDEEAALRVLTLLFDGPASSLCAGLVRPPSQRRTYGRTSELCDQLHVQRATTRACLAAAATVYPPDLIAAVGAELDSDLDHERAVGAVLLVVLCLAGGV